jgi:hypothetical protein
VKRLLVLAGIAGVLLSAAACGNSTDGQPTPVTSAAQGQPTRTTTPSAGGGGALPVDHACSLLSSSDLSQLGVSSSPSEDMIGTAHACEFDNSEGHIIVGIRTNVGLAGFSANGGTVGDITVGTHQAKQDVDDTGSCVIAIGVSASSRVDVTVTGDGTSDPCPTSMAVARMVEPKLP